MTVYHGWLSLIKKFDPDQTLAGGYVTLRLATLVTSCVIVEFVETHIVSVNGTVIFSFCMLSIVLFVTCVWSFWWPPVYLYHS